MLNVNVLMQTLLGSFMTAFGADFNAVKSQVLDFLADKTPRVADIAKGVISGDIKIDMAKAMMQNELTITESEFIAIEVETKQMVQDALNSAISTVTDVINQFIPPTPTA